MSHTSADLLRDARELAWHASTYAALDFDVFAGGTDARYSAVYCRSLAPDIPWRAIIDMRSHACAFVLENGLRDRSTKFSAKTSTR